MSKVIVRYLEGLQAYEPVSDAMHQFTDVRGDDTQDELWFLQHSPVFTQGQAGKAEHLLATGDIPVVQSDRGGQVTYHGPGQLVVYFLLDLERKGMGPRHLVSAIERAIVNVLAKFDISAYPKPDAPGVYVDEQKIASLGLRIRKRKSFHGLALNLDMDLEPFDRINPCGYAGLKMTQLRDFLECVNFEEVSQYMLDALTKELDYQEVVRGVGLPESSLPNSENS